VQNQKEQLVFDSELSAFEYPFEVYSFSFQSQEKKLVMRYGDLGSKSNSKVAVLLHGKNFSGHYWDRIAKDLVEKGYRVIIPDQIGFGKSSKPTNYQYSFAQLGINTIKLLDHLGVKDFSLVGHSMGGMLAVHMTSMTRRVQKLYLINPIGLEDYLRYVEFKDPSFFYEIELKKTVEDFRNYQKKNYYDGQWNDKYEELLTPFKGWVSGPNKELVDWNNALTYGPIFSEEIVSKFANLKVPTYLVLGTRDRAAPGRLWKKPGVKRKLGQYQKLGKEIQGLNPKIIKIFELTGLGHMPHFEDYERFSKVFFPLFNSGTL
jgi:pimeloyl-ACP methyl ester carboxylesterase